MIFCRILIPDDVQIIDFKYNLRIVKEEEEEKENLDVKYNLRKLKKGLKVKSGDDVKKWRRIRIESDSSSDVDMDTYICSDCGKNFNNPRTLRSHLSNDCGKLYICSKCKKTFTYRASYCRHKKKRSCQRKE